MRDKKENILCLSSAVLKIDLDCKTYYDVNKCLSYNRMFNVIMGGRGIGKTTQFMIWVIKQCIKKGRKFIYVRRTKDEAKLQKNLLDKYLDNITFVGDGSKAGGTWYYGKEVVGYLKCLSKQADLKSVDFDDVDYIIYDEAILMPGQPKRYLKNEIEVLLEFMSTVFRQRTNYKVFILGNNLDFFNPYCQYFNIKIFNRVYVGSEIYVEYAVNSESLIKQEEQTPLYKLTLGTKYHEYHYGNEVFTTSKRKTVSLEANDKLLFHIQVNNYTLSFYRNQNDYITVLCRNLHLDDNRKFVLIDNNELNYYFKKEFKASTYYNIFFYYYGKNLMYGTTDEANALVDMVFECIK